MSERFSDRFINQVDDRLAIGLSREIIRKVGVWNGPSNPEPFILKAKSENQRKKAMCILRDDMKNKLIGFKVKKGFFEARMGFFEAFSSKPGKPHDALVVLTSDIDLRQQGSRGPHHHENWPFVSNPRISAFIEVHAIARLIQRGGAETMEDVMAVLKRAAAWSDHVTWKQEEGSWMLPIDTGIVFIQNRELPEERGFKPGMSPACMIKTFISYDRLSTRYQDAWRRLSGMGIMDTSPAYPSWSPMSEDHEKMWQAMREEGRFRDMRQQNLNADMGNSPDMEAFEEAEEDEARGDILVEDRQMEM